MAEQNVDVVVRARDATREAFKQVEEALADLNKKAQGVGDSSKGLAGGIRSFYKDNEQSFKATGIALGALVTGVTAVAAGIVALGVRGSEVDDIRQGFKLLNDEVGNNSTQVLGKLKASFAGTVSDFNIMKLVNESLSKGLKASATDFELIGDAARIFADRGLGTTEKVFQDLSQAMAVGKTKGAELLIGVIEQEEVQWRYAKSIGKTFEQLTELQKNEALAIEVKRRLREEVERSGKAQMDFGDAIAASGVMLVNFKDTLGEAIATSPVVQAALMAFKEGFDAGFGADTQAQVKTLTSFVNRFAIFLVDAAQVGISAAGFLGQAWSGLKLVFAGVMTALMFVGEMFLRLNTVILEQLAKLPMVGAQYKGLAIDSKNAADFIGGMRQSFQEQTKEALKGVQGQGAYQEALNKVSSVLSTVKQKMVEAQGAIKQQTDATTKNTGAAKDNASATDLSAKEQAKFAEEFKKTIAKVRELDSVLPGLTQSVGTLNDSELKSIQLFLALRKSLDDIERQTWTANFGFRGLADELVNVGIKSDEIDKVKEKIANFGKTTAGVFQQFPKTLVAALTGGGGLMGAVSGFGVQIGESLFTKGGALAKTAIGATKSLSKMFGDTIGGALGAAIPGIGALIGPGIQLLWGGIKKLFGGPSKAELEGRSLVSAFEEQVQGMLTASQKLEIGNEKWKLTTVAVRDAYLATGKSAAEAETDVAALWASSKQGAEASKAAIDKINQVLNEQKKDAADLDAAIQKYGFSIEQLGPAMQKQKLSEQAGGLLNEFRLLIGSGIDMGLVTEKMSGNLNKYVQIALKTGQEVPSSMQPILQKMIEMGTLTDADGKKITDLKSSGISFSDTMTQGFQKVVDKLDELLQGLGVIPAKIKDIPNTVPDPFRDWEFPKIPNDFGSSAGNSPEGFQSGGIRDFGAGRLAVLHGREAIIPLDRPSPIGQQLVREIAGTQVTNVVNFESLKEELQALRQDMRRQRQDVFVAVDARGEARRLTRSQFKQIEQAVGESLVRVPRHAVGSRVR